MQTSRPHITCSDFIKKTERAKLMKVKVCGMKYWENIQEVIDSLSRIIWGLYFTKNRQGIFLVLNLRYVVK